MSIKVFSSNKIGSDDGGMPAETGENVGNYSSTGALPTERPAGVGGGALQNGDYVRITADANVPFNLTYTKGGETINVQATVKGEKIFYENSDWFPEPGNIVSSDEVVVEDSTTESISGTAANQQQVNIENKTRLNKIIDPTNSSNVFRIETEATQQQTKDVLKITYKDHDNNDVIDGKVYIDRKAVENGKNVANSGCVFDKTLDNVHSSFTLNKTNPTKDVINISIKQKDETEVSKDIDLGDKLTFKTNVQTLTNKTIDADDNTIQNLEFDNFKSDTFVGNGASDTQQAYTKEKTDSLLGNKTGYGETYRFDGTVDAQNLVITLTPVSGCPVLAEEPARGAKIVVFLQNNLPSTTTGYDLVFSGTGAWAQTCKLWPNKDNATVVDDNSYREYEALELFYDGGTSYKWTISNILTGARNPSYPQIVNTPTTTINNDDTLFNNLYGGFVLWPVGASVCLNIDYANGVLADYSKYKLPYGKWSLAITDVESSAGAGFSRTGYQDSFDTVGDGTKTLADIATPNIFSQRFLFKKL